VAKADKPWEIKKKSSLFVCNIVKGGCIIQLDKCAVIIFSGHFNLQDGATALWANVLPTLKIELLIRNASHLHGI
jgi:hypothetical protein